MRGDYVPVIVRGHADGTPVLRVLLLIVVGVLRHPDHDTVKLWVE